MAVYVYIWHRARHWEHTIIYHPMMRTSLLEKRLQLLGEEEEYFSSFCCTESLILEHQDAMEPDCDCERVTMRLVVQHLGDGHTIELIVEQGEQASSIAEVKKMIRELGGVAAARQQLFCADEEQPLEDDHVVMESCTLFLLVGDTNYVWDSACPLLMGVAMPAWGSAVVDGTAQHAHVASAALKLFPPGAAPCTPDGPTADPVREVDNSPPTFDGDENAYMLKGSKELYELVNAKTVVCREKPAMTAQHSRELSHVEVCLLRALPILPMICRGGSDGEGEGGDKSTISLKFTVSVEDATRTRTPCPSTSVRCGLTAVRTHNGEEETRYISRDFAIAAGDDGTVITMDWDSTHGRVGFVRDGRLRGFGDAGVGGSYIPLQWSAQTGVTGVRIEIVETPSLC
jgi:hypothetical protein